MITAFLLITLSLGIILGLTSTNRATSNVIESTDNIPLVFNENQDVEKKKAIELEAKKIALKQFEDEKKEFFSNINNKEDVEQVISKVKFLLNLTSTKIKDPESLIKAYLPQNEWVSFTQHVLNEFAAQSQQTLHTFLLDNINIRFYNQNIPEVLKIFNFISTEIKRLNISLDNYEKFKNSINVELLTPKDLLIFKFVNVVVENYNLAIKSDYNLKDISEPLFLKSDGSNDKVEIEQLNKFIVDLSTSANNEDTQLVLANNELVNGLAFDSAELV